MEIIKAMDYFMTSLETEQLSSHSIRAYKQDLNQFLTSTHKVVLDNLCFEDFHNYFIKISCLKMTSIKRKRVVLHKFLKFCYRKKLCKEKLYDYIDPIKSKKTNVPKEILSRGDIAQIFNNFATEKEMYHKKAEHPYYEYLYYCTIRNALIVHILLYTGCRAHEVISLKKTDIDLFNGTLTLFTKGKKYNQVPIHQKLLEAFNLYYEEIAVLKSSELLEILSSSYLFPSRNDKDTPLSTRTLHDLMNHLSQVLDKHIHAHLFRHTFASYCIAAQMDISTIAALISHSNPSITLSIYTHEIDARNKEEQIKKLSFM